MSKFGQILSAIGEFGVFQKRLMVAICIPSIFSAFHMFSQVFTGLNVPHHCNTKWILSIGPNLTREEQQNLTLPKDPEGAYESCSMFSQVDWDLESIKAQGINSTSECTDGWQYDTSSGITTLVTERSFAAIVSHSFFAVGQILLSGIAYGVRQWRTLQLVLSTPALGFAIYYWILPESARWLLSQGKQEEAWVLIQKAARANKSNVPEKLMNEVPIPNPQGLL
ncbi:hypothetical protein COCON_G00066120 [Conger conger]|uniref:Uncharacterized protein n=1 Tax=Conger conger TaxID=82655 RepID=A0A9Q1I3Y0_CONCO|nr:hypothetical protein COCON_G00066120 [Conger conger]